ncbi:MAG: Xaa-Pro peptidase family protein [Candidatus Micrarchaeaceae archaeon]
MEIDGLLRKRLKSLFRGSDLDVIVLMNTSIKDSNFTYMTDFSSGVFEDTILLLFKDSEMLLVNKLEREIALENAPKIMNVKSVGSIKEMSAELRSALHNKAVGFNAKFLPYSYYKAIRKLGNPKKMVDVSKKFSEIRTVKDGYEISRIKKANTIAKRAFDQIQEVFSEGITERKLAAKFNSFMLDSGASSPSFDTIVCFGKNSALPHHSPDNTKLRANSIILIDAGAKWGNYCSDLTRTYFFRPDKSSKVFKNFEEMYETVSTAQSEALKIIRPGIPALKAHVVAEKIINSAYNGKYAGKFIHSLGHSIGIDVHDESKFSLSPSCNYKLAKNMVFSDEPGIYVVGTGGVRLEEDVLVTSSGAKII